MKTSSFIYFNENQKSITHVSFNFQMVEKLIASFQTPIPFFNHSSFTLWKLSHFSKHSYSFIYVYTSRYCHPPPPTHFNLISILWKHTKNFSSSRHTYTHIHTWTCIYTYTHESSPHAWKSNFSMPVYVFVNRKNLYLLDFVWYDMSHSTSYAMY
jgi:hypothetical protein